MSIDGIGLSTTLVGGILIYAGIRGYSALAVVQNLVTGKPITTDVDVINPLTTPGKADVQSPIQGPTSSDNARAIGKTMAASMGWNGPQWDALEKLWTRESGWNPRAKNPSSGAYGIPQALPHTKMPKMAWPESAGGMSDATTQIQWGLNYIKQRYGNPVIAWAFWQRNNWY